MTGLRSGKEKPVTRPGYGRSGNEKLKYDPSETNPVTVGQVTAGKRKTRNVTGLRSGKGKPVTRPGYGRSGNEKHKYDPSLTISVTVGLREPVVGMLWVARVGQSCINSSPDGENGLKLGLRVHALAGFKKVSPALQNSPILLEGCKFLRYIRGRGSLQEDPPGWDGISKVWMFLSP